MIAHIFRLSVWEWHKLRRRWLPWVLLAIVVILMQSAVWGAYVVHRSEPFSPTHGIQLSDTEGENKEAVFEAEWKCKDVRGDRIPPGVEELADGHRDSALASVEQFRESHAKAMRKYATLPVTQSFFLIASSWAFTLLAGNSCSFSSASWLRRRWAANMAGARCGRC